MAKQPSHDVWVNVEGTDNFKVKIGAIFPHDTGDGFNIVLNANSIDGKMVAFPTKKSKEDDEKT